MTAVVVAGAVGLAGSTALGLPACAASAPNVYRVAKYPVQAQASDAVTAKAQALADGQQGAFRSLLKRLVPVTAYKKIPKVPLARVQDMVAGFSVRSERNSSTEYLASYDFEFQARAVRELLRSNGVAYVEEVAQPITLVTHYSARADGPLMAAAVSAKVGKPTVVTAHPVATQPHLQAARVAPVWTKAWADLDTDDALTPVKIVKSAEPLADDSLRNVLLGDGGALRGLAAGEAAERTVLAYAEPSADGRKLLVTLVGRDAVGWMNVTRAYPILDGDVGYATELAAVVGLGILEGRWKALRTSRQSSGGTVSADNIDGWSTSTDRENTNAGISTSRPTSGGSGGGWSDDVEVMVEFRGLGQWQQMRRRLAETPGVEDLEVGQMSARSASVKLRYPGGPERLAAELQPQGMQLSNHGGQWVLQAR